MSDEKPLWIDLPAESGDFVDIVRMGSHHSLGDLDCWCRPTFELVPSEGREKPVVMIKHNAPPHSFVSGDMKLDAMEDSESIVGSMEYQNDIKEDDTVMICECCGITDNHEESDLPCSGPAYQTILWIDEDGSVG